MPSGTLIDLLELIAQQQAAITALQQEIARLKADLAKLTAETTPPSATE